MGFFKRPMRMEIEAPARKAQIELARERGNNYLAYAKQAFEAGDIPNARSYAEEGLFLTGLCKYYVAVREQLLDFLRTLPATA
jgi:hypothetical protein